jgi:hypothetical protein
MSKHFLYLTNDRLISLIWKRGTFVARESFLAGDASAPTAVAYVAKYRHLPTFVIADLVEEDFRLDTIPHLRGADSEAVTARKLGQLYRASTLRNAIVQGRETEGRRDDKVLYHAVANTDIIKPWLDLLEQNEVPIEGVYSSSVLSAHLLKALNLQFPHTLLVTVVPDFGLRQTYFQNRQVKFSRITPIVYDEGQSVGALIAAETNRTWQYLDSLRNFTGGETLEVCMLVHERDRAMVADAVRSYPLRRYRFLDIASVADTIGLSPAPQSSHAEQILVHAFAKTPIRNHFADPPLRRFATFRRTRNWLFGVTAAALAIGIGGTAFIFNQVNAISSRIEARERAARSAEGEYQTIFNTMRAQKLASDVVRDTSAFFNKEMRTQGVAPGAMLRDLSRIFSEFPRVRLLQIVWASSGDEKFSPPYGVLPPNGTLEVTSTAKGAGETAVQTVTPSDTSSTATENPVWRGAAFQVAMVDAAVTPFDGNFRATLAEIERFAARLNTVPGLSATVQRRPLDVDTTASIVATGARSGDPAEARFVVRVVRRMGGK